MSSSTSLTSSFMEAVVKRRSTYSLLPECTISNSEIKDLVKTTLEMAPSTFGSYTTRIVVLVKDEHKKFWDIAIDAVRAVTPPEQFEGHSKQRLEGFKNAYGTMLFLEDPENTRALEKKYPPFAHHFQSWSQQTSAIHQFILWTALTSAGLGANLQHYNPLVDAKTQATWNIPADWTLIGQLVFGKPTAPPGEKAVEMKAPLEKRMFFHGADF